MTERAIRFAEGRKRVGVIEGSGADEGTGDAGGDGEAGEDTEGAGEMAAMEALEMNSPIGMNWKEISSEGSMNCCSWSRPLVQFDFVDDGGEHDDQKRNGGENNI